MEKNYDNKVVVLDKEIYEELCLRAQSYEGDLYEPAGCKMKRIEKHARKWNPHLRQEWLDARKAKRAAYKEQKAIAKELVRNKSVHSVRRGIKTFNVTVVGRSSKRCNRNIEVRVCKHPLSEVKYLSDYFNINPSLLYPAVWEPTYSADEIALANEVFKLEGDFYALTDKLISIPGTANAPYICQTVPVVLDSIDGGLIVVNAVFKINAGTHMTYGDRTSVNIPFKIKPDDLLIAPYRTVPKEQYAQLLLNPNQEEFVYIGEERDEPCKILSYTSNNTVEIQTVDGIFEVDPSKVMGKRLPNEKQ